jgi:ribosomal protein S18 acetylase RimI-like enzyme
VELRPFSPSDEAAVVDLWQRCGLTRPWNDPRKDIHRKLTVQPELFLVGETGGKVVASVMAGYDGHRGWVNYLAVAPDCRNKGYGRLIMRHVEERLSAMGCPKLNLQVRADNTAVLEFYRKLGYAVEERASLGKRLIPDLPPR